MKEIFKWILKYFKIGVLGLVLVCFGLWVKDPVFNFISTQSSEVPLLRKIVDFSSVRVEPKQLNFRGNASDQIQKSFKVINDSDRPVFRFRVYVSSVNSSVENIDIFFPKENQITANEFDQERDAFCSIYHLKTQDSGEGKLINIYKIPEKKRLDFYIIAKGGTIVKFDPVEWNPEESGMMVKEKGATQRPVFFTSNLGSDEGKLKHSGTMKGMKQMLFKY